MLLDTNALLWQLGLVEDAGKLGVEARRVLESADVVCVSSISLVEMHIKTMLGRLDVPAGAEEKVVAAGDQIINYSGTDADAIRKFPALKRHDPFDRMLIAQASSEGLVFMTADQVLLDLGLDFVIDARL